MESSLLGSLLVLAVAFLLQSLLWPVIEPSAFILFYPAVFLIAFLYGPRLGLAATFLSALISGFFFLPPLRSVSLTSASIFQLALFVLMGALFSIVNSRFRSLQQREHQRLAAENMQFVQLLRIVATSAARTSDPKELLKFCLDQVCVGTGWDVGHAFFLAPDSHTLLIPSGVWHFSDPDRFRSFRDVTMKTSFTPGVGMPGRVLETGKPLWIDDVSQDPNFPRAKATLEINLKSAFGCPILVDGKVQGVLEFFSEKAIHPDAALLNVLEHLGTQLGQAFEHKRAEDALRESETRHRMITDSAYDAFVGMDEKGLITDWNPQAVALFGWPAEEVRGKPLRDLIIPPAYREAFDQGLSRFLKTGHQTPLVGRRIEVQALRRDGNEFPVEIAISPFHFKGHYQFSAFVHDISQRKKSEQLQRQAEEVLRKSKDTLEEQVQHRTAQLKQALIDLSRGNDELEQFASIASHDLQEPLRTIIMRLQLLQMQEEKLDPQSQQHLESAVESAHRMRLLIQDILNLARAGRATEGFHPVNLNRVMTEAQNNLKVMIEEYDACLHVSLLPTIYADSLQMVRLFQNLIGNAIKYHGDKKPEVSVTAKETDTDWRFEISDNGIGIEEKYWDRIFSAFQRLHSDRKKYPGSGIGLAICKKIVEQHGGKIWVSSKQDEGSTFHVSIPKVGGTKSEDANFLSQ